MNLAAIKPRQLEVFVTLADLGQVTQVAASLSLTQPAVSMALAELERQLGPLFEREKGRLRLNPRGRECLPKAREILARLADLAAPATAGALTGELRIGASNSVGNYMVGELLGAFMRRHPQVTLQVRVDNTGVIADSLLAHEIDLGCVEGPVHHPQLDSLTWREDELTICAAPEHPLARKRRLRAADFAGAKWILREPGSATRSLSETVLMALPQGQVLLELGQIEGIKQAVMAGLGIACLPKAATPDAVATGRLCILPTPFLPLSRRLSLILPRSAYRGRLVDAFVDSLFACQDNSNRMPAATVSKTTPKRRSNQRL